MLFILLFVNQLHAENPIEYRTTRERRHLIFHKPKISERRQAVRGILRRGDRFAVYEKSRRTKECRHGMLRIEKNAFLCKKNTNVVLQKPEPLPKFIDFISPAPKDFEQYKKTNRWPELGNKNAPVQTSIHARRGSRKGRVYKNIREFLRNKLPTSALAWGRTLHFDDAEKTSKGWVLRRRNGTITPMKDVKLLAVSRFRGRDLAKQPVQAGYTPAYSIAYDGAIIYTQTHQQSATSQRIPYHTAIEVQTTEQPSWLRISSPVAGYVKATDVRWWEPAPPPVSSIQKQAMWIDVHLRQQMMMLYKGTTSTFVTLISSGKKGWSNETKTGIFQIYSKAIEWDLGSRSTAKRRYFLEKVPWVMHYFPRFAFHSALWHNNFGRIKSHGCINLSLRDAHYLFTQVTPKLPAGWPVVRHAKHDPGTIVRIRDKDHNVADMRKYYRIK